MERREPNDTFWEATVQIFTEDENGKIKKTSETHLIDAPTVSKVEEKLKEEMEGQDYKIKNIKTSHIVVIY